MRNIYAAIFLLFSAGSALAQASFSDDFDIYALNDYIAQASPNWTTWSGAGGGPEDAQAVNTNASSGSQSAYFASINQNGGPQDFVLPFGGQYSTGAFHYEMDMFVTTGQGAYFNFQANATIGQLWAMDCFMNDVGDLEISNTNGVMLTSTFPHNQWFQLAFDINLNTNQWRLSIDGTPIDSFANSINQIASINLYPSNIVSRGGNGLSQFWVDDVSYTHTPYVLPNLNAAVVLAGSIDPVTRAPGPITGFVGQSKTFAATVRNLGLDPITSFDLAYDYDGNTSTTSVTGVNIPSLGTRIVTFPVAGTLAAGTHMLDVTVSNVNGAGIDGDTTDDHASRTVTITAVAAPNKVVVSEEVTGTWCQWCPRGTVYMDYMHDTYPGYHAGIAVHNADPMTVAAYDDGITPFISGYPAVLVERGAEIDPLDIEQEFLAKLQVAPTATLWNGANLDAQTRALDVSIAYTFTGVADSTWRVACVLTEDSVRGTINYNQANAYGNNAVGPMGGFELLGPNVPAALMHYNHVGRAISPRFTGEAAFTGTIMPGNSYIFNFRFILPASWNENQMSIVGMLIDGNGEIDNGSMTTMAEAIFNGFQPGTYIVGVDELDAPDALISLYPNPTTGKAWLSLNLTAETEVQVTLRDLQGRVFAKHNYGLLQGSQQIEVNAQGLARGMYMVQVSMDGIVKTERLVRQ